MQSTNPKPAQRCTHKSLSQRGAINLPVLENPNNPSGQIRKSKSGKRRAIVLATVQLLMLAHIALWLLSKKYGWFGGRTITPVEPSESMEFASNGVINAGLIFFSIALLSTLILGRWFCGWGCHIVMLQDLCGWMMKKCGIRPKPFRSRFLIYFPLGLALYMFIMPMVYRMGMVPLDRKLGASLGDDNWFVTAWREVSTFLGFALPRAQMAAFDPDFHLTTDEFWKTFPSGYSAIIVVPLFLFICGFAMVYFLGAKGFCTYGCPYGGFFRPLDRLAPARIIVTDACEGCGHCTAVCTSNVRVHEEVREYGMVVDPGCMKCLDCVSVCPNDALYFGFAKPALLKGAPKNEKPKRVYDMTLGEEFACTAIFLLTWIGVRGAYGMVPMLMAAGVAGMMTFLIWKLWRIIRDQNVTLHKFQLKLRGSVKPVGWVFAACVGLLTVLTIHSSVVNAMYYAGDREHTKASTLFAKNGQSITPEVTERIDRAIHLYRSASSIAEGGYGLIGGEKWQAELDFRIERLLSQKGDYTEAERVARRAIERDGLSDRMASDLAWLMAREGRVSDAIQYLRAALLDHDTLDQSLDGFVRLAGANHDTQMIVDLLRERIEKFSAKDNLNTMRWLSIVLHDTGAIEESLTWTQRTIEIDPHNGAAHAYQALTLAELGRMDEAIASQRRAVDLEPKTPHHRMVLADLLEATGKSEEAAMERQRGEDLQEELTVKQQP